MSKEFSLPPKVGNALGLVLFGLAAFWIAPRAYSMLTTAWESPQQPLYRKVLFFGFVLAGLYMLICLMVFGSKSTKLTPRPVGGFLLGSQPPDKRERQAWFWGRQAIYGVLAAFLCWLLVLFIEVGRWLIDAGH